MTLVHEVFHGLDGTNRTDTFNHNIFEMLIGTGPWVPDTDDDGLTDGQEALGATVHRESINEIQSADTELYELNPTNPDTDGDGYWDGWIGVYNVSYTHNRGLAYADNVILYRQNLHDGGGVRGEEIVQEQVMVHRTNRNEATASARKRSDVSLCSLPETSFPSVNRTGLPLPSPATST